MRHVWRGVLLGLVLFVYTAPGVQAERARFSASPILGDRTISWRWDPIPGSDPYYHGNTVLDSVSAVMGPEPGRAFRILKASKDGRRIFSVYEGEDRIFIWNPENGAVERILDAPPANLLDFDIHETGKLVLGGLRDGRIGFWDLTTGTAPSVFQGHLGQVWKVRFLSGASVNEKGFVSAADEDTLKIWLEPGSILTRLVVRDSPTLTLDVTTDAATIAAGDALGNIRIFKLVQGRWGIALLLQEHDAPISSLRFCADRSRLFSADRSGRVIGWSTQSWRSTFPEPIQLDRPEGPFLGLRDPDGALVYTLDSAGTFQIFDGLEGRPYRIGALAGGRTVVGAAFADIGKRIILGLDNGELRVFRTGFCEPSEATPDCFGGYMIWRSPTPAAENAVLLRIFGFGDSTWTFVGPERTFMDPDSMMPRGAWGDEPIAGPHNGLPFYYSVTDFHRRYANGGIFRVGDDYASIQAAFFGMDSVGHPIPVTAHPAARTDPPLLSRVIVVPNPYEAGKSPWDGQLGSHVDFMNLPDEATIRIYTTTGDHLRTITHSRGQFGESTGREPWDLKNQRGEDVTSGVYIYLIRTPLSADEAKGYFIVVR